MRILGDLILNNLLTTLDGPFTKPSTRAGWSDWIWIRIKSSRRENEVVSIDSIVSKTSRNTVHNVITALRMNDDDLFTYEESRVMQYFNNSSLAC